MFVYQMLMGDADHSYFFEHKGKFSGSPTPWVLYLIYIASSFFMMIVLLNIIIAIMGNTQTVRTELGRKVIYKNQMATLLRQIHRYNYRVNLTNWMKRADEEKNGCWCCARTGSDEHNQVQVFQGQFPKFLTVAYRRSTDPES